MADIGEKAAQPQELQRALSWLETHQQALVADVAELLRIRSVKEEPGGPGAPFGRPIARALEKALQAGDRLGLRTANVDGYAGYVEWGDGPELVAVLNHLDVVPEGAGWSVPPYAGVVQDGKIWGRGAVDNKGPAVAALYALAALAHAQVPAKRRVRLILGTDEESGMRGLRYYLEHEGQPTLGFSPDALFPIVNGEKGIMRALLSKDLVPARTAAEPSGAWQVESFQGGERANIVPDQARLRLVWAGPAGRPGGGAAAADAESWQRRLQEAAERVLQEARAKAGSEARGQLALEVAAVDGAAGAAGHGVSGALGTAFPRLEIKAQGIGAHASTPEQGINALALITAVLLEAGIPLEPPHADAIRFLHGAMATDGSGLDVRCADDLSGPLTNNLGVLQWENGRITANFNLRYPIRQSGEELAARIRAVAQARGFTADIGDDPPHYVPPEGELIQALQKAYEEETHQPAKLLTMGGGTYARLLKNAVAFGPVFPGQPELAHQRDEYISVADLLACTRICLRALYYLAAQGS